MVGIVTRVQLLDKVYFLIIIQHILLQYKNDATLRLQNDLKQNFQECVYALRLITDKRKYWLKKTFEICITKIS